VSQVKERRALDLVDLIGLRYASGGTDRRTGVDCLWIVREVAMRIFPDFDPLEIPISEPEARAALDRWRDGDARWHVAGRRWFEADRPGLVLWGTTENGHPWCAITIDERGRFAVSANEERGVFRAPVRSLEGLEAIYRRLA